MNVFDENYLLHKIDVFVIEIPKIFLSLHNLFKLLVDFKLFLWNSQNAAAINCALLWNL